MHFLEASNIDTCKKLSKNSKPPSDTIAGNSRRCPEEGGGIPRYGPHARANDVRRVMWSVRQKLADARQDHAIVKHVGVWRRLAGNNGMPCVWHIQASMSPRG
jgi:hypothetical protein